MKGLNSLVYCNIMVTGDRYTERLEEVAGESELSRRNIIRMLKTSPLHSKMGNSEIESEVNSIMYLGVTCSYTPYIQNLN